MYRTDAQLCTDQATCFSFGGTIYFTKLYAFEREQLEFGGQYRLERLEFVTSDFKRPDPG